MRILYPDRPATGKHRLVPEILYPLVTTRPHGFLECASRKALRPDASSNANVDEDRGLEAARRLGGIHRANEFGRRVAPAPVAPGEQDEVMRLYFPEFRRTKRPEKLRGPAEHVGPYVKGRDVLTCTRDDERRLHRMWLRERPEARNAKCRGGACSNRSEHDAVEPAKVDQVGRVFSGREKHRDTTTFIPRDGKEPPCGDPTPTFFKGPLTAGGVRSLQPVGVNDRVDACLGDPWRGPLLCHLLPPRILRLAGSCALTRVSRTGVGR